MKYVLSTLLLFFSISLFSQTTYTIKGRVTDKNTSEPLTGVNVMIKEKTGTGDVSDADGDYSISIASGNYTLIYRIVGHENFEKKIRLTDNVVLNAELLPDNITLGEVEVSAIRKDQNVKSVISGVERLEIETINKIPVLLGERDILKALLLLPGVQSAGEGNTGFYVRGGSEDQNLILLDNATVYNPSHLFGFFSTFNSDAVADMTIYKGAMPANYGGRLSSTLDVNMRDGNMKKYGLTGGIGL